MKPLQVRQDGVPVMIPGAEPRAILTVLGLQGGSVVSADVLTELPWGDASPRTAAKALQTHISSLRHSLGDGFVISRASSANPRLVVALQARDQEVDHPNGRPFPVLVRVDIRNSADGTE